MNFMPMRVVLDTNVVFEGLTKQTGVCGLIIDAWCAGLMLACVSNALLNEYDDVLSRKLSAWRYVEVIAMWDELLDESTHNVLSWRDSIPSAQEQHRLQSSRSCATIRLWKSPNQVHYLLIRLPIHP